MTPQEQYRRLYGQIAAMGEQIAELRERFEYLENCLLPDNNRLQCLPPTTDQAFGFHLTRQEDAMLAVLLRASPQIATRETIAANLWPLDLDQPDQKILNVLACKIRKKLSPFGIEIKNVHGVGFVLSTESADKIRFLQKGVAA
jgi:DNA-binding response OmpR family regulator